MLVYRADWSLSKTLTYTGVEITGLHAELNYIL